MVDFPDIHENWPVHSFILFFGILFIAAAVLLGQGATFYPGCNPKVVFMDCPTFLGFLVIYMIGLSQMIQNHFKKVFHGIPGF